VPICDRMRQRFVELEFLVVLPPVLNFVLPMSCVVTRLISDFRIEVGMQRNYFDFGDPVKVIEVGEYGYRRGDMEIRKRG
jgi:hypothetical protein